MSISCTALQVQTQVRDRCGEKDRECGEREDARDRRDERDVPGGSGAGGPPTVPAAPATPAGAGQP
jgi:hypothetical protein